MVHSFTKVDQQGGQCGNDSNRPAPDLSFRYSAADRGEQIGQELDNFKCLTGEESSSESSASVEERSNYFDQVSSPPQSGSNATTHDVCFVNSDEFMKYLQPTQTVDRYESSPTHELDVADANFEFGHSMQYRIPNTASGATSTEQLPFPVRSSATDVIADGMSRQRQDPMQEHPTWNVADDRNKFQVTYSANKTKPATSEPNVSASVLQATDHDRTAPTLHSSGTQTGSEMQSTRSREERQHYWNNSKDPFFPYKPPGEAQVFHVLSSTEEESETSSMLNKVRHVSGKDAEELDAPVSTSQVPVSNERLFQNLFSNRVQQPNSGTANNVGDQPYAKSLSCNSSTASFSSSELPRETNSNGRSDHLFRFGHRSAVGGNAQSQFSSLVAEYEEDARASSDSSNVSNFSVIKTANALPENKFSSSESIFSLSQSARFRQRQNVSGKSDKLVNKSDGKKSTSEVSSDSSADRNWKKLKKVESSKLVPRKYESGESPLSRLVSTEVATMLENCTLTESTYAASTAISGISSTCTSSNLPSTFSKPDTSASPNEIRNFMLLEHQRKLYIKRLKKEIRWLEKIQRLLKNNEEKPVTRKASSPEQLALENKRAEVIQARSDHRTGKEGYKTMPLIDTIKPLCKLSRDSSQSQVPHAAIKQDKTTQLDITSVPQYSMHMEPMVKITKTVQRTEDYVVTAADENLQCHVENSKNTLIFDNENFRFVPVNRHLSKNTSGNVNSNSARNAETADKPLDPPVAISQNHHVILENKQVVSRSVQTSPPQTSVGVPNTPERCFISLPVPKETLQRNHVKQRSIKCNMNNAPSAGKRKHLMDGFQELSDTRYAGIEQQGMQTFYANNSKLAGNVAWHINAPMHTASKAQPRRDKPSEARVPNSSPTSITLQEALARFKGDFVTSSKARMQNIKPLARMRQYTVFKDIVSIQYGFLQSRERSWPSTANQAPSDGKRTFTDREMKTQTKKLYRALPETVNAKKDKHRKAIYETNRLKAQIFKNRILERTLRGQVSFSLTKSIM